MPLWKLEPVARSDDPRWQDYPIWCEVIVRASTAAAARTWAAKLEATPDGAAGNESLTPGSRLADAKMYACAQVSAEHAGAPEDGEEGVVNSELLREGRQP